MFNFPSDFGVPGFRVSQPDDPPGFRMNENSLSPTPDRGYVLVSGDSPAQDPLRQAVDRANVPVSGGSPSQDPLQQAVDRAANLYPDPRDPTAAPLTAVQIGGLIGGFLGGTLGALTNNPHVTRAGATIGGGLGMFLGREYGNGSAGRAISAVNNSGLAGVPGM